VLLDSAGRSDVQAIVAGTLGLDPEADAETLWQYREVHRGFFGSAVRGELDLAIARIRGLPQRGIARTDAEDLMARLLLYFSNFERQMIGAGVWCWRNPPTRLQQGQNRYFIKSAAQDLRTLEAATAKTFKAFAAGHKNSPRDAFIKILRAKAKEHADKLDPHAALPQLEALLSAILPVKEQPTAVAGGPIGRGGTGRELYTEVHGVTPVQALAFAAFRLIQLKSLAPGLVSSLAAGKPVKAVSLQESWPSWTSREVAVLLHVDRTTFLGPYNSKIVGCCGDERRSVREELDSWDRAGVVPASELLDEVSGMRGKGVLVRPPLRGELRDAQRFDILPDWRLRRTIVDIRREAEEARRRHRPPNVWKASGRK
jgi:hypothetical protein